MTFSSETSNHYNMSYNTACRGAYDLSKPCLGPGHSRSSSVPTAGKDVLARFAPGALWGVPGTAQPSAWDDPPDATPAGAGRGRDAEEHPVLDVGQTAEARVCPRDGHVSIVPARDTAAHRRHHARRGDWQNPPPSEARCRPTPHCAGPY